MHTETMKECILNLAEEKLPMPHQYILDEEVIETYLNTKLARDFAATYITTGSIDKALTYVLDSLYEASLEDLKITGTKFIPILIGLETWKKSESTTHKDYIPQVEKILRRCRDNGGKRVMEAEHNISKVIAGKESLTSRDLHDIMYHMLPAWIVFEKMPETYRILTYTVECLQPFAGKEEGVLRDYLWKFLNSFNNIAID